jgi:hypothetical protein
MPAKARQLLEEYQTKFADKGAMGFDAWHDGCTKCPSHDSKLT